MRENLEDLYTTITEEVVKFFRLDATRDYNFIFSYVVSFIGIISIILRKHG